MKDIEDKVQKEINLLEKILVELHEEHKEMKKGPGVTNVQGSLPGFLSEIKFRYSGYTQTFSFEFEVERKQGGRYAFSGNIDINQNLQINTLVLTRVSTINPYTRNQHTISNSSQKAFDQCVDELMAATIMFVGQNQEALKEAIEQAQIAKQASSIKNQHWEKINKVRNYQSSRRRLIDLLQVQPSEEVQQLLEKQSENTLPSV